MFRIHMIINESINREVLHQSDSHSFICNLNVYFFRLSLIHVDAYLRSHVCVSELKKKTPKTATFKQSVKQQK